ncbi:hypothetical protein A0256_07645 [Mucilaginibacter sp. PAMC 26640]|nr:hypothetical protein A0256_07645 [Mucilaginibacter sp. PAMC 26640]
MIALINLCDLLNIILNNQLIMNIFKCLLIVLLISLLSPGRLLAQTEKRAAVPRSNVSLQKHLDKYLSALKLLKKFNGCIYVSAAGHEILKKAYNLNADPKSTLWVTNESQFDIHSVSKLMAYSILVKLQAEHKVTMTDTLGKYLPQFNQDKRITIDQLLHHSSGLPRELTNKPNNVLGLNPDQIIYAASKEKLEFAPGTDTRYSNVGYEVIYYLIKKITGKPFVQCVEDYIFKPLGMRGSGAHFIISHTNLKHPALNHQLKNGKITRIPNITQDEFATARIYSTTGDLMVYLQSLTKEPFRSTLKNAQDVIEKNGGADGIRAQIYTDTRLNYSFVLLSNYDEIPFQQTITDLISIMESKPYQVPAEINRKAITLPINVLKRYVGKYDFAEANHTQLAFKLEDGHLALYQNDKKLSTLLAESETTFFEAPKAATSYAFTTNRNDWDIVWTYQGVKFKGIKIGKE